MTFKLPLPQLKHLTVRGLLDDVHLWTGLILCLPLVMLGVTGSVLVFVHELHRVMEPDLYKVGQGEPRAVSEIVAAARTAVPPGFAPGFVALPEERGDPAIVRFAPAGRGGAPGMAPPGMAPPGMAGRQVFLDPGSLDVLGTREIGAGVLRTLFFLHANLLVRDRSGREAVGWLGVAMLALGITGLVLWWPRRGQWKAAFLVKLGAKGLRFQRDLHGAVGIWGLAVFVVVSFSGVYLCFPQTTGDVIRLAAPARDLRGSAAAMRVQPVAGGQQIGVDQAVALARLAVPDGVPRYVFLAQRPDQPMRVAMAREGDAHGAPLPTAFIDPWRGAVIELRDPRTFSLGETIMAWQHGLHAGEGLGWTWKILVFLSGFLPLLFSITGVWMWLIKRRTRREVAARRLAATQAAE